MDGDGRTDLYVTNYGPNVLYRNAGNGAFTDITRTARVGLDGWSTSCAFLDVDRDGDLDLFVANYLDAPPSKNPFCGDPQRRIRVYCHRSTTRVCRACCIATTGRACSPT